MLIDNQTRLGGEVENTFSTRMRMRLHQSVFWLDTCKWHAWDLYLAILLFGSRGGRWKGCWEVRGELYVKLGTFCGKNGYDNFYIITLVQINEQLKVMENRGMRWITGENVGLYGCMKNLAASARQLRGWNPTVKIQLSISYAVWIQGYDANGTRFKNASNEKCKAK